MDNKKIIGQRINSALALSGKMQKDLASVLGVTDNTVSYYVGGKRSPSTDQLREIAKYLGVTSDYLLGLSDTPSPDIEDQAICKKLGIEGETLEALKYIFLGVPWDNIPDDMIVPSFIEDLMNITLVDIQNTREAFSMFIEGAAEEKETNKYHSFLRTLCKYKEALAKIAKIDEEDEDTRERYEEELYAAEWRVQKGVTSILNIIAERITMPDEWRERKEGR
ncbi:MAG: helix-turn-helix transcriptional regulator [Ruminococcaceae bacterium]|nr:helix-turn-helix transcriptional regulator [Oscillospiraceae bacterium]